MSLKDIMSPRLTICNSSKLISKKQILEQISSLISKQDEDVNYQEVLEKLLQRERIGNTAIGHGVAIPHARIKELHKPRCTLISLNKAINFAEQETTAVDLIFGLLVPEHATEEHLKILAEIAKKMQDKNFREELRHAKDNTDLYQIATTHIDQANE